MVALMQNLDDLVTPFYIDKASVRGRLVRLSDQLQIILNRHKYPPIINHYLCEIAAIAAALAVDIKQSGLFTLQITNGSVIKFIVVDITQDGEFRACAKWNNDALNELLIETNNKPSLGQLFGSAVMVFSVDLPKRNDRYQAIVELNGATLCESIHNYFRQSEQIPTALIVHVEQNTHEENNYLAGALLIQNVASSPSSSYEETESNDEWITDVCLLSTLTKKELLDSKLPSEALLHRLFHERELQIQNSVPLTEKCSCSRQRIEQVLSQFSNEERQSMILNNQIEVKCEFCSEVYCFNEADIEALNLESI
jgi:molecular chaperone Hsp33